MGSDKNPGHLERILSKAEREKREPGKPPSLWTRTMATTRRRVIAGILFLIPIATTIWFVKFFLETIYTSFEPVLKPVLEDRLSLDPEGTVYTAVGVILSVVVVLAFLYLVGIFVSRTFVRRVIALAEQLVVHIPFVKFFYKTTKQIVDALSLPTKGSVKKVVVIDFFRTGMKTLAFATGETPTEGQDAPYVNLFVPTTPNPTSGYLVMLPPSDVWETNLTMEEAMTLIVSGGILPPERLSLLPYRPLTPSNTVRVAENESDKSQAR